MTILDFNDRLSIATTTSEATKILDHYFRSHGFSSYAFTYYAEHTKTGNKLQFECVSKALKTWHNYYLEQGYADVDRTLERANQTNLPTFWDAHTQLANSKNTREKRIRLESIQYGIDKGLSIPVYGPNHDFATLTLHQRKNETCLNKYVTHQYEWFIAAQLFYHYIRKLLLSSEQPTKSYNLTKREKQCLILTAKNWRVEQIAKELKISLRTVNFHLQNANKKMGVNNKYQAILKWNKL